MQQEKNRIKEQLEDELRDFHFQGEKQVLNRLKNKSFGRKVSEFWNKEVEIPLLPAGIAAAIFLSWGILDRLPEDIPEAGVEERDLVETGGSTYWKDQLEKAVAEDED